MLKKLGKQILCTILEWQVRRLRQKNQFQIIAVAGSVGKTSTKLAIAKTLGGRLRVRHQEGNYNDRLTVPLVLFGHSEPGLFDVFAWTKLLLTNERILRRPYAFDAAVLELGTDGPGQMVQFSYVQPELLVLTAIADEHMEYFGNLPAVAAEELSIVPAAKQVLLNLDDIASEFLPDSTYKSYGLDNKATYRVVERHDKGLAGQALTLQLGRTGELRASVASLGEQGAKIALAAAATAQLLGYSSEEIQAGLAHITPVPGRMQILSGVNGSTIIDDTYNASPVAVKAALKVLYETNTQHRIAILGTMNELGDDSAEAHRTVGALCDPNYLEVVITIGKDAKEYLAPAAEAAGCQVVSFMSPYDAGTYAKDRLPAASVVLAKGSQNGVFAEEAVKLLLKDPQDADKLVRQSPYWLKIKQRQFSSAE